MPRAETIKRDARQRVRFAIHGVPNAKTAWDGGLGDEIDFWRTWFAEEGMEWGDDYHRRLSPDSVVEDHVMRHVDVVEGERVSILDVGAGPLTCIGKTHPHHPLDVQAVDALADAYRTLMDEMSVEPPVRTQQCETERVGELFAADSLDVTHARNTLDHSFDPLLAIRSMAEVTRPGGVLVLLHYPNEAAAEDYQGLHQWNLSIDRGSFVISRPTRLSMKVIDVADELSDLVETVELTPGSGERTEDLVVLRRR
jgi:SAM-dependent methyltransferase